MPNTDLAQADAESVHILSPDILLRVRGAARAEDTIQSLICCARVMAVLQHNWTGHLAIHAAHTDQLLKLSQPVKGVSTAKIQSRGAWLKCSSHARLRLHSNSDEQQCTLSLHVHDNLLLQLPLSDAHLKLAVLPCEQSSLLLLLPKHQDEGAAARITYCFAFFDQPDCDSFTSALQTMLDRQQQLQQQQQTPQHHDSSMLQQAPQQPQAAGSQPPQQQARIDLEAMAPAEPYAAQLSHAAAANHLELLADAKEAVKRVLLDPDFQRLVDHVDAVWDEVEAEIQQQGGFQTGI